MSIERMMSFAAVAATCGRSGLALMVGAVLASLPASSGIANGELIQLRDGKSYAGRVLSEDGDVVRVKTGTGQSAQELEISTGEIAGILRDDAEADAIAACRESEMIARWAQGYFQAGLPSAAGQCIQRAVALDATLKSRPLKEGGSAFRGFWNERVFRIRSNETAGDDRKGLIALAKWAHDAGLREYAGETLRYAWQLDKESSETEALRRKWNVMFSAWARPDVVAAAEVSLFRKRLRDQGVDVEAQAGREFVLIPIEYQLDAGKRVLSKVMLPKPARSSYYGVYPLYRQPGAKALDAVYEGFVAERMELRPQDSGGVESVWKNHTGPRSVDGSRPAGVSGERIVTERPSGWAVIVLEVDEKAAQVQLEWGDGFSDRIDLDYIRQVGATRTMSEAELVESPLVQTSLGVMRSGSTAMVELALAALAGARQRLTAENANAWAGRVTPAVLAAGVRAEASVRDAAWNYLAVQTSITDATRDAFASAPNQVKRAWVDLIEAHAGGSASANSEIAAAVLKSMLVSGSKPVCERAVGALMKVGGEIDWPAISRTSQNAQWAVLRKLQTLPRESAIQALLSIMKSAKASSATAIAEMAEAMNLSLTDPRDPLILKWGDLKSDSDRVALMTVLAPAKMGELLYSEGVAAILRTAERKRCTEKLRSSILRFVVRQAAMELDGTRPVSSGKGFPVLSRLGSSDPVQRALIRAAGVNDDELRWDGLAVLIRKGFSHDAARLVVEGAADESEIIHEFEAIGEREGVSEAAGYPAFCGWLLDEHRPGLAGRVLKALDEIVEAAPEPDRWRIRAAVKTGVHVESLGELTIAADPAVSRRSLKWMTTLGHFTRQDEMRFTSSTNSKQRRQRLRVIDRRKALLIDGQYGGIAVIESSQVVGNPVGSGENATASGLRWSVPQRRTLILPTVVLASNIEDPEYRVLMDGVEIGRGVARQEDRAIREPEAILPALVDPDEKWLGLFGWGWPAGGDAGGSQFVPATGPAVLPGNRPVLTERRADFMTLDLTESLASILVKGGSLEPDQLESWKADPLKVTLRYGAFGSFAGVSPWREFPKEKKPGACHVLNVMVILERN